MLNIDISTMSIIELSEHLVEIKKHKTRVIKAIEQRKKLDKKIVIKELKDHAKSRGFSWEELFGAKTASAAKTGRKSHKSAPKYRNPKNPEQTWTGRGPVPRWIRVLRDNGITLEQLLIPE